jgi:hypothetical protein
MSVSDWGQWAHRQVQKGGSVGEVELSTDEMVQITQQMDRFVVTAVLRAIMFEAHLPPAASDRIRAYLGIVRGKCAGSLARAKDDRTRDQNRTALLHFEKWASDIDRMLERDVVLN